MSEFFKPNDEMDTRLPGEQEINEPVSADNGYEADRIFADFDKNYEALKAAVSRELTDYKEMYLREKKQADVYRSRVLARDVLEVILPALAEIKNDVLDAASLDDAKMILQFRYKQLSNLLRGAGVRLQFHERNQAIDGDERVNGAPRLTSDPSLHQRVASSTKIGCTIRGEEDNPILEELEIYVYDPSLQPEAPVIPEEPVTPEETATPETAVTSEETVIPEAAATPETAATPEETVTPEEPATPEAPISRDTGVTQISNDAVRLDKDVIMRFGGFSRKLLLTAGQIVPINEGWSRFPKIRASLMSCDIYLGETRVAANVTIHNGMLLLCRIYRDRADGSLLLEFAEYRGGVGVDILSRYKL